MDSSSALSPGGKKLMQPRLPFKVVSPGTQASPSTPTSSRKRKLSSAEESANKLTKSSKENELVANVIEIEISDDESETKSNKTNSATNDNKNTPVSVRTKSKKTNPIHNAGKNTPKTTKTKSNKANCYNNDDRNTPKTPRTKLNKANSYNNDDNNTPETKGSKSNNTNSGDTVTPVTDKSSTPEMVTPKRTRAKRSLQNEVNNEAATGDSPRTPKLTPKQLQRQQESAKKREEREKEKLEREMKRQQEKMEKDKLKQEKEEQRKKEKEEREEQKRKEKEEKEEQKKKEREEKERLKELDRKEKEEQKRIEKEAKEEEKRKKLEAIEEEKRQKELEKQEQELKKKKAAAAFVNFFLPKQKTEQSEYESKNTILSSFTVKSDMRLAPTIRITIDNEQKQALDDGINKQTALQNELYVQGLKEKIVKPKNCGKTWPLSDKEEDCMIVDTEDDLPSVVMGAGEVIIATTIKPERMRAKLLSFHENRRPPYWGTWRKKSKTIGPRKPFGTDIKQLDYEVDSDSEWEDEGDGESIAGSVAGSVDEEKDEYEVDNDLFVPHGYLSDEEGTMDGEEMLSLSPETQKLKLKHLEDEFESEMKKPTEKLKPRIYGVLWENSEGGKPENCIDPLWNYFLRMAMILNDPTELLKSPPVSEEAEKKKTKKKKEENSPTTEKKRKSKPVKKEVETKKAVKSQPAINSFLMKINV